jgi:acetylornithine deacetylase/succinyl-diaminopimelate desuccinylase-like protein
MLSQLSSWYKKNQNELKEELFSFLRFQSISTDPNYQKEIEKCAAWLNTKMQKMGFESKILKTKGHPVIYAEKIVDPKKPTLLFYGHYDVQPVDPLDKWHSDPFEPKVKGDLIFARGASDNKGQLFYTITAFQAYLDLFSSFPVNIKCLFEGEEEAGSRGLEGLLPKIAKQIKADCLIVPDVDIPSMQLPAITLGARGIATFDITLQGSDEDLHSGAYGNIAFNPLRALTLMLSKCWDSRGKVTIPGFYDHVVMRTKKEREQLLRTAKMEKNSLKGIYAVWKEGGYTPLEACWIRPSLEINGMHGGYTGEGFKTVIPNKAQAKISCRLVPDQDPKRIEKMLQSFFMRLCPPKMKLSIQYLGGGKAVYTSFDNPFAIAMRHSYEEIFHRPCGNLLTGGSVPIIDKLKKYTKDTFMLIGTALPTDLIHAPNEHFAFSRLEKGLYVVATMIGKL